MDVLENCLEIDRVSCAVRPQIRDEEKGEKERVVGQFL